MFVFIIIIMVIMMIIIVIILSSSLLLFRIYSHNMMMGPIYAGLKMVWPWESMSPMKNSIFVYGVSFSFFFFWLHIY